MEFLIYFFFTSFSVVEGWPPDVSQNLSNYLKPNINTTLIKPNLPLGEQISWRGENYSKTHILICVHSAVNSSERRDLIRRTWAKEQKTLPTKVIFLIGISKNGDNYNNNILKHEANQNQDLLQEDFIDTYNNLTLKSMFMLKYAQSLSTVGNFSMSLKVYFLFFLISFFKPFFIFFSFPLNIRKCN